jgi:hypothetical protein
VCLGLTFAPRLCSDSNNRRLILMLLLLQCGLLLLVLVLIFMMLVPRSWGGCRKRACHCAQIQ